MTVGYCNTAKSIKRTEKIFEDDGISAYDQTFVLIYA